MMMQRSEIIRIIMMSIISVVKQTKNGVIINLRRRKEGEHGDEHGGDLQHDHGHLDRRPEPDGVPEAPHRDSMLD